MNERIRELAKEAGFEIDNGPLLPGLTTITMKVGGLYVGVPVEKFAELIVRECVAVAVEQKKWVQNQQATFNYDDDRWDRARIQQSDRIIGKIREHFGVEE